MEIILNMLAKILEAAANFTSASTSIIMIYQPEKPECLKNAEEK
ncbi:MAG: cyclic lactone autoinducer peptide [Ruminococcus sp.]